MRDARNGAKLLDGTLYHSVGARQRGSWRQLDDRHEIALVLCGNKAARRAPELNASEDKKPREVVRE